MQDTARTKANNDQTKVRILKELSGKPMMPSDISRKLDRKVPTIVEHLERLVRAGLVEKKSRPGRKFVFYSLTESGASMLSDNSRARMLLYCALTLFMVGAGILFVGSYNAVLRNQAVPAGISSIANKAAPYHPQANGTRLTVMDYSCIALMIAALGLLLWGYRLSGRVTKGLAS